jgi:preprotein translocase subunit SecY
MMSGGAMGRMSIFAMGVMPYINSSIIMSLLQGAHVIPYLDRLAKEGETGRRQTAQPRSPAISRWSWPSFSPLA